MNNIFIFLKTRPETSTAQINAVGEVTKHSNNQEDAVDDAQGEKG